MYISSEIPGGVAGARVVVQAAPRAHPWEMLGGGSRHPVPRSSRSWKHRPRSHCGDFVSQGQRSGDG